MFTLLNVKTLMRLPPAKSSPQRESRSFYGRRFKWLHLHGFRSTYARWTEQIVGAWCLKFLWVNPQRLVGQETNRDQQTNRPQKTNSCLPSAESSLNANNPTSSRIVSDVSFLSSSFLLPPVCCVCVVCHSIYLLCLIRRRERAPPPRVWNWTTTTKKTRRVPQLARWKGQFWRRDCLPTVVEVARRKPRQSNPKEKIGIETHPPSQRGRCGRSSSKSFALGKPWIAGTC